MEDTSRIVGRQIHDMRPHDRAESISAKCIGSDWCMASVYIDGVPGSKAFWRFDVKTMIPMG